MIYTRTINEDGSTTTSKEDLTTPPCEDFIEMIARKQKENQNQDQDISALTPWEVNVGSRLSELGEAIITRRRIRNDWYRELCGICDFITYMEMNDKKENRFYD